MIKKGVEYKDVSCVYCIQNKINGKRYIGQTKCLYKRSHQYSYAFRMLQKGGHLNDHLLNAVRKYREGAFVKRVDFKEYIKALEVPVDSNREF